MSESVYCQCNDQELHEMPSPLFRLICHCKTCQEFFRQDYNDECTYFLRDCLHIKLENIDFRGYQKGHSPIKRGKCKTCGKISYCRIKVGPFPEFLMVPSARVGSLDLPRPFTHVYYGSRVKDIHDDINKIYGHYRSQLVIFWAVIKAMMMQHRRKSNG